MQDIARKVDRMQVQLDELCSKISALLAIYKKKKSAATKQREIYSRAKKLRERGLVPLPTTHVLTKRDCRLSERIAGWARVGMKFGALDKPEDFLAWLCYTWNNRCYLKKPITYSGGYFRVHTGDCRYNFGRSDLMGLNLKQRILLRHEGDAQDFCMRPWWDWAYNVLLPVYSDMEELPNFHKLPPRFLKCVRLVLGGYGGHEVYTGIFWDQHETMLNINKMLKRVGPDLHIMWKACCRGLLMKSSPATP